MRLSPPSPTSTPCTSKDHPLYGNDLSCYNKEDDITSSSLFFTYAKGDNLLMYQPLADRLRPKSLDDVAGQQHILGEKGVLRRIIQGGTIPNLIFYGPSGTGKTTVAEIAAARIHRPFYRLNATTASLSDIKAITADVGTLLAPDGVVLYLDEIQYFNKKQQQSLLEFMENG